MLTILLISLFLSSTINTQEARKAMSTGSSSSSSKKKGGEGDQVIIFDCKNNF
jgi:hypothetical protein